SGESYDVYGYKTTVSGNYTIDNAAITRPSDKVSRDILVKQSKEYVPSIENGKPTIKKYVGGKLVSTESCNVNASITASNGNDVYADNANFTTNANGTSNVKNSSSSQGNFTVTTESGNYTSTMTNGAVSATNSFAYSYDKSIVYKNGDYSYTFNGVMPLSESTDDIVKTGTRTISGESYDVYGYKTTVSGNYTIDNAAITRPSDKVSRDILVKQVVTVTLEDQSYTGTFKSSGAKVSTTEQHNDFKIVTRTNNMVTASDSYRRHLDLNASASAKGDVKMSAASKPTLKASTPGSASITHSSADGNGFVKRTTSRPYTITMSDGAVIDVATAFDKEVNNGLDTLDHTAIRTVSFVSAETPVKNNSLSTSTQEVYDVVVNLAVEVDRTTEGVMTKAAGESYPLSVAYHQLVDVPVVPTVDTTGVVTVEKNGTLKVAIYFDGVYQFTDTYNVVNNITASAGKDLTGDDIDAFATTSNGTSNVSTRDASNGRFTAIKKSMRYTSTVSDGNVSDQNVFAIEYTDAVEYVFGSFKHTFNVSWTHKEGVKIGSATTQGSNEVYPYTSTLNGVHTIDNVVVGQPSDVVTRNIIIKGIEDNIPGTMVGMAVTAVPAVEKDGKYYDVESWCQNSKHYAHKCFNVHTSEGTYVVVMPMSGEITLEKVLAGDFWSGTGYSQYNSGREKNSNGRWEPASAKDVNEGIKYYINDNVVRSIANEVLAQWGWSNKKGDKYSTVVDGYIFTLDNNTHVLTVRHNGKVVLRLK
ncbi:MAG: hypothetical protein J5895_00170, partial [Alphaproteobacteria bacterium]|nr:hypothetical protein [Alphaproteobacteria bacterium]